MQRDDLYVSSGNLTGPGLENAIPDFYPVSGLLSSAWRELFSNLNTYLPLSVRLFGISFASAVVLVGLSLYLGVPLTMDGIPDAAWMARTVLLVATAVFVMAPVGMGIYGVAFRSLDSKLLPLKDFDKDLRQHFAAAVQLQAAISLIAVCLKFVLMVTGTDSIFREQIVDVVVEAPFMLAFPAIVRFNMGAWDAANFSLNRFFKQPFAYFTYHLGAVALSLTGFVALGFGYFVTAPVYIVAMAVLLWVPEPAESKVAEVRAEAPKPIVKSVYQERTETPPRFSRF
jgi:hypothetical protein